MGGCRAGFLDEGFRLFSFRNAPPVEVSVQLYLAAIVQAEGSEDLAIWGFGSGSFRPESPPFFAAVATMAIVLLWLRAPLIIQAWSSEWARLLQGLGAEIWQNFATVQA